MTKRKRDDAGQENHNVTKKPCLETPPLVVDLTDHNSYLAGVNNLRELLSNNRGDISHDFIVQCSFSDKEIFKLDCLISSKDIYIISIGGYKPPKRVPYPKEFPVEINFIQEICNYIQSSSKTPEGAVKVIQTLALVISEPIRFKPFADHIKNLIEKLPFNPILNMHHHLQDNGKFMYFIDNQRQIKELCFKEVRGLWGGGKAITYWKSESKITEYNHNDIVALPIDEPIGSDTPERSRLQSTSQSDDAILRSTSHVSREERRRHSSSSELGGRGSGGVT